MSQIQGFLQGEKSFFSTYKKMGLVPFVIELFKSSKVVLIKRFFSAIHAKGYGLYKKYRYSILLPYLKFRDQMDVLLFRRNLLHLHRKLANHLESQKKLWKSHIYTGGYFYQGWADIGIRGIRETNQRFDDYGLQAVLNSKMRVLDIGCNNGFLALKVAQFAGHVDAIEFNPFLVDIGKDVKQFLSIDNIDFIVGDFAKFDLTHKYDLIMSLANHQTGDGNLKLALRTHMERLFDLLNDGGIVAFESHVSEVNDPEFRRQMQGLMDMFTVIDEITISQYKITYIGDRLFFILKKSNC